MAAGNAVIGALRVVLGADTAALEKGLKSAQSSLNGFSAGAGKALAGAATAFAVAATALGVSVKGALNEADKLGKMAQSIGVPVEQLSALKHAADLSGVSLESLGTSLGKLSKTLVEAAAKPTSEAANAFRALGVAVKNSDGTLKSSEQALLDIADKFAGLKDGAGKTAVAMALFGRSGASLIPLLNEGGDGIRKMKDEAKAFGIVLSDETVKAATEFNDNLARLGKVWDGVVFQLAAGAAGPLADLSRALVELAKNSDGMKAAGETIGDTFKKLFEISLTLVTVWQRLGVEFKALGEFLQTDIFGGKVLENWTKFTAVGEESQRILAALHSSFQAIEDPIGVTGDALAGLGAKGAKGLKDINVAALGGKTALDSFIESTKKHIAAQNAEAAAVSLTTGAKERMRVIAEGLAVALASNIPPTDALTAKIQALGAAVEQTANRVQGANLVAASQPLWTQYQTEIANTAAAMRAAGATEEELGRNNERIAQKFGLDWKTQTASVAGSMSEMASAFGEENARIAAFAKVFSSVQALISTYAGAAEALKLPFPANIAASAAVLAKGLTLVAAIKSAAVPKMTTGGAIRVGGSGGVDSQLVQIMASPDEQIDIWRPGEGGDPRRGAGGDRTIRVITDTFTRPIVEKLIPAFNDAIRDGHRLVVVSD